MKKLTTILLSSMLVLAFSFAGTSQVTCTIEIANDIFIIDGAAAINPGDVVCLLPGNKDYLLLRDIQGTEAQPITIINKGGAVIIDTDHFYGIKFDNCKHVIFSGNGQDGVQYGIQVKRVAQGCGMSVDNMSTNIEIEFVEISYTAIAGIYAKTDPYHGDCDNLITRDKFTMYDLKIHDCYLHDIDDEGLYIGSSKYTGQTIYDCDEIIVFPHVIIGVEIYNNLIENTGWDGIQVSSAPDDCNIHNNIIRNDSYAGHYGQMSGILIGGGSKCDCYNNKIYDGKGDGIDVFGMGFMKIYNNLIVRPGRTFEPGNPTAFKSGIYIGHVPDALSPGATFKIYNNTIISPKSYGVTYNNNQATMGYVANNLITDPGYLIIIGNDAYVNLMVGNEKVTQNNNFLRSNNSSPRFIDANNNDFDLEPNSAAVNYGTSLTTEGITFDIDNRFRPFHTYFDAGAYECHHPYAAIDEHNIQMGTPYPIPAKDYLNIPVNLGMNGEVHVVFTSLTGKMVFNKIFNESQVVGDNVIVDLTSLQTGKYIISITTENQSINKTALIVK